MRIVPIIKFMQFLCLTSDLGIRIKIQDENIDDYSSSSRGKLSTALNVVVRVLHPVALPLEFFG